MSVCRFHLWRKQHERGAAFSLHGRVGMVLKSKRAMEAELWFSEFATSLANRMPDTNRMELPACLTISKVHSSYCEAMRAGKTARPLSIRQFRRMWKTYFPNVVIPKVRYIIISLIKGFVFNILSLENKLMYSNYMLVSRSDI